MQRSVVCLLVSVCMNLALHYATAGGAIASMTHGKSKFGTVVEGPVVKYCILQEMYVASA